MADDASCTFQRYVTLDSVECFHVDSSNASACAGTRFYLLFSRESFWIHISHFAIVTIAAAIGYLSVARVANSHRGAAATIITAIPNGEIGLCWLRIPFFHYHRHIYVPFSLSSSRSLLISCLTESNNMYRIERWYAHRYSYISSRFKDVGFISPSVPLLQSDGCVRLRTLAGSEWRRAVYTPHTAHNNITTPHFIHIQCCTKRQRQWAPILKGKKCVTLTTIH